MHFTIHTNNKRTSQERESAHVACLSPLWHHLHHNTIITWDWMRCPKRWLSSPISLTSSSNFLVRDAYISSGIDWFPCTSYPMSGSNHVVFDTCCRVMGSTILTSDVEIESTLESNLSVWTHTNNRRASQERVHTLLAMSGENRYLG
jgi:hypothetical protein